jgi:hypothetical protein
MVFCRLAALGERRKKLPERNEAKARRAERAEGSEPIADWQSANGGAAHASVLTLGVPGL